MVALISVFGVADPLRITLFAAGACFFGALLVTDPRPKDRARTLGWAAVVAAVAAVLTVYLNQIAVWAVATFLVVQMFLSFALRSWSPRAGNLAWIGALTTFLAGAGHIAVDRLGWFVIASTVGLAWLAAWQLLILPDRAMRALNRCLHAFSRRATDVVARVADIVDTAHAGIAPDNAGNTLRRSLKRVRSCRTVIDNQVLALVPHSFGHHDVEQLRVALYSAQAGLEQIVNQVTHPQSITALPDDVAGAVTTILEGLATALKPDADAGSLGSLAHDAQLLRDDLHDVTTRTAAPGDAPKLRAEAVLGVVMTIEAAQRVAESTWQAKALATHPADGAHAALRHTGPTAEQASPVSLSPRKLQPSTALALQAVVAAVVAGLIAKWLGNEQTRLVAWTAFVVIAGSAGASARRAWTRLAAIILGATAGVLIAAIVPRNTVCVIAVVVVGVFFTIFTAPVSYAGMVFWLCIAVIPLLATEGFYLELIKDQALAALIGGCVAAAVALTVAPIRLSRDFRPAVVQYLDTLDKSLDAHLPGQNEPSANTASELDRAHADLDAILASAATEIQVLPQPGSPLSEQGIRVDAVHDAYLRLAPLLSDSTRRLLGWTDQQIETRIHRLQDDVEAAKAAARGDTTLVDKPALRDEPRARPLATPSSSANPQSIDVYWRLENLHAALADLAEILGGHSKSEAPVH